MHPGSFEPLAVKPPGLDRAVEHRVERELPRRRIGELRGRKHRGTRIDERRDLALGAAREPPVRRHDEIAAPLVADAGRGRGEQQQDVHAGGIERSREPRQVRRHALDPQRVGIHVQERLGSEPFQRLHDAAAGVEQFAALVRDFDLRPRAAFQMPLDLVRHVMHVDDRRLDARIGKPVQHMIEQRLARRPSPAASAACRSSGRMRVPSPAASTIAFIASAHCGGETWASYQAFRSFIAGWISARRR